MLETDRLVLRPWRVSEAAIMRELWTERDPRVPLHRRIDGEGRPTVEDLEDRIRSGSPANPLGLLAAERKGSGEVIGYCGLTENPKVPEGEPELAFEFLRRVWGQGFATEAAWAVLRWAEASGYPRLWATVSDWNVASRRVLAKLGFVETGRVEPGEVDGEVLFTTKQLHPLPDRTGTGAARSSSVSTSTVDDDEPAAGAPRRRDRGGPWPAVG